MKHYTKYLCPIIPNVKNTITNTKQKKQGTKVSRQQFGMNGAGLHFKRWFEAVNPTKFASHK